MPAEVSASQAAQILQISRDTVWRVVRDGSLPARRQGMRGIIRIDVEDLRAYAEKYQHRFDEELAQKLAK